MFKCLEQKLVIMFIVIMLLYSHSWVEQDVENSVWSDSTGMARGNISFQTDKVYR